MNTRHTLIASAMLAAGLVSGAAHAALQSRLGGQAVYDTDLNVTWLANANLAATNSFGVAGINASGIMDWNTAQSWIGAMNAANYLGYNDWRLPTTLQPDASCSVQSGGDSHGVGCTGSEMGHLFYSELGGLAGYSITTTHNASYSLFNNVQAYGYWSGTTFVRNPAYAWLFYMNYDLQDSNLKTDNFYAWAVRPGDVAAVPEPAAFGLMLSGLALIGAVARRRKA